MANFHEKERKSIRERMENKYSGKRWIWLSYMDAQSTLLERTSNNKENILIKPLPFITYDGLTEQEMYVPQSYINVDDYLLKQQWGGAVLTHKSMLDISCTTQRLWNETWNLWEIPHDLDHCNILQLCDNGLNNHMGYIFHKGKRGGWWDLSQFPHLEDYEEKILWNICQEQSPTFCLDNGLI